METNLRHVVVEGLPAAGKSEILGLLARFYPCRVRVLPELVKSVVEEERIDLFQERGRLTDALAQALPRRYAAIAEIMRSGFLCLEESHLGVHYAYSVALADPGFVDVYESLAQDAPHPDLFVRLALPVPESVARQAARGTPQYAVDAPRLTQFLRELDRWHGARRSPLVLIDADRAASAVTADLERILGLTYEPTEIPSGRALGTLLLLGRPASGKSEFIDFMNRADSREREASFHLGKPSVADDFPILWRLFEDDDARERIGRARLYSTRSDANYAVADEAVWDFLIERLNDQVVNSSGQPGTTTLIEFSRGGPSGYRRALERLSASVLAQSAILYLSVSFEESWRRNLARYDERRRSGTLTHSVPREEMERTYGTDDWPSLTHGRPSGWITIHGTRVPFVTLYNEPESVDPLVLARRYRVALEELHRLWSARP